MSILPVTVTLNKVVKAVTGKTPRSVFNDKRETFERRYKFTGITGVPKHQLDEITREMEERHPERVFSVSNRVARGRYKGSFNMGLSVKVNFKYNV